MDIFIAGAGIGGLSAALFLHAAGHKVRLFEAAGALRELGVGINVQSHAVAELARLGLQPRLEAAGNPCIEWGMYNAFGQEIWREPRGLKAGHDWPQISIHRGRLQGILGAALTERLGAEAIAFGHRFVGFEDRGSEVTARFATRAGEVTATGDILIGADGIHSALRRLLHPNEGDPIFNGAVLWRGITRWKPYLSGGTQVFIGTPDQKFIVYPITPPDADGMQTTNWIAQVSSPEMLNREDWNREGRREDFLPLYDSWSFDWLDVPGMIRAAETVFEFPMVDCDPLPRWGGGRVTLLGDAAHPMVPIGANGGSQAIRDGAAIADALAARGDPIEALAAYEALRRPATAEIVLSNRQLGPEEVMKMAHERAPQGFRHVEDVISRAELEEVSRRYRTVTWAKREPAAP
jgi:2-polyprenyl-6-methoxyphenol hydroxylase-like FAD-dependent oxidoreductase